MGLIPIRHIMGRAENHEIFEKDLVSNAQATYEVFHGGVPSAPCLSDRQTESAIL
jgi:hypothetical protein